MENQGQSVQPPAPDTINQDGQAFQTPAVLPPDLEPFVDNGQPDAPPDSNGNGQAQGQDVHQPAQQGQDQAATSEEVQNVMRIANQRYAEILRLQQENERLKSGIPQGDQVQSNRNVNPYDPQNDFAHWWQWEKDDMAKRSSEFTFNRLGAMAQHQSEVQWQMSHPNVGIEEVKNYARSNGIAEWNLDLAYRDMTRTQILQNVATTAAQRTMQSFQNPQQGAQPLRGTNPAGANQVNLRFEKMLEEFTRNPQIYDTWPTDLQQNFDRELMWRRNNP